MSILSEKRGINMKDSFMDFGTLVFDVINDINFRISEALEVIFDD